MLTHPCRGSSKTVPLKEGPGRKHKPDACRLDLQSRRGQGVAALSKGDKKTLFLNGWMDANLATHGPRGGGARSVPRTAIAPNRHAL